MIRRGRVPLVLGAALSALAALGVQQVVSAADAVAPITIEGSGAAEISSDLVTWQDTLAGASQSTDMQYFQRGSKDGRQQLLDGLTDFAVSGRPFTAAQLASRPKGAPAILDAPISVASLSILFSEPSQVGWSTVDLVPGCDPTDPDIADPEACYVRGTFTGPFRMPAENVSAMILNLSPTFKANGLANWQHADIRSALGTSVLSIQRPGAQHTFVERTEGAAANYALMDYAKALGPTAWALRQEENPEFDWEPVGEEFSPRVLTRFGADTQMGIMAFSGVDAATGSSPDTWTGNAGPVSTTSVKQLNLDYPDAKFVEFAIQNAYGDWVKPTKATISKALNAGSGMNVAAHQPIAGAYPLVWVNRVYVVSGSLTPEKANSMAAMIRYIATDGQSVTVANGGAPLTASLRAEALKKADAIVKANCTAKGYEVSIGGPGPFEPATPGVQAIASMSHCTLIPPPPSTTTTTTPPTTAYVPPTTVYVPPYIPPYVPPTIPTDTTSVTVPETTTTVESGTTTTTTAVGAGGGQRPQGRPLDAMPMEPSNGGGSVPKPLGTMLLGAGGFLLVRRTLMRRKLAS